MDKNNLLPIIQRLQELERRDLLYVNNGLDLREILSDMMDKIHNLRIDLQLAILEDAGKKHLYHHRQDIYEEDSDLSNLI